MEKPIHPTPVGKVSQIANLFQRKPIEIQPVEQLSAAAAAAAATAAAAAAANQQQQQAGGAPATVARTESHSARFNNARALFEKLGVENNSNSNVKMSRSGSRDDNLCEGNNSDRSSSRSSDRSISPPKRRSPFPPGCNVAASLANNNNCAAQVNGGLALSNSKFIVEPGRKLHHNIGRHKSEDGVLCGPSVGGGLSAIFSAAAAGGSVDKPEKPERKFNSRELIEKQKKWTSHFTKTKSNRTHSDQNRCDIIRTVPGTTLFSGTAIQPKEKDKERDKEKDRDRERERDRDREREKENVSVGVTSPNVNHKPTAANSIAISNMEQLRSPILAATHQHPEQHPPSPPVRHTIVPPEIKPRSTNKIGSPIKSPPLPPIPAAKPKTVSPVKFNPERGARSPTKLPDVTHQPPPPPVKSAAVTAALQRSLDQQAATAAASVAPVPPEKPRKKSIDLIEGEERLTPSSPTSASFHYVAAKRGSMDSLGGAANGLSGSINSATSLSPAASASSGPGSPVHTEDEKQENESTEKSEMQQQYYNSMPRTRRSEKEGRSNKIERQDVTADIMTQNQKQQIKNQIQVQNHSNNMSPQRSSSVTSSTSSKRISSSITVQLPAAGLGSRPSSIISTSTSLDEGGFNEPSPEIKAKLKPVYDFETANGRSISGGGVGAEVDECDHSQLTTDEMDKHSLNYVDVGYRLNPDGSESHEVFGESELYDTAKVTDMHKKFHANGFAQETTTVYATIKTEVKTAVELYYPGGKLPREREREHERIGGGGILNSPTKSVSGSPVKSAAISSPPVGVVSPICRRSSDVSITSTPPISPTSIGSGSGSCSGTGTANSTSTSHTTTATRSISSIAVALGQTKGVVVAAAAAIAVLETHEEFDSSELPALPERPPPTLNATPSNTTLTPTTMSDNKCSALDTQDLEYADSSAGEDEDDLMRAIEDEEDDDVHVDLCEAPLASVAEEEEIEEAKVIIAAMPAEVVIPREDSLPDAMTADEAERLLSSRILESKIRQQSLLSDEQAKEVEQILSAAPTVGVAVAAVVATATSPTSIKNLIEETQHAEESTPTSQQEAKKGNKDTITTTTNVAAIKADGERVISCGGGINAITVIVAKADEYNDNNVERVIYNVEERQRVNDDDDDDDDEDEDVDIVGIGAAPAHILNATFTKADRTTQVQSQSVATNKANNNHNSSSYSNNNNNGNNNSHDDDEPEWLRDVLEAPNRSLENLLISRCSAGRRQSQSDDSQNSGENLRENKHSELVTASKVETSYDADNDSTLFIQQQQEQSISPSNAHDESQDQQSLLNRKFIQQDDESFSPTLLGHQQQQQPTGESLQESIVSVESTQSDATLNQTTTIDDSIISSRHNSTYSLAEGELHSINTNTTTTSLGVGELDDSQYYIPEYPPVKSKEVYVESGVHYFEDGNFWMEVPGLLDFDDDEHSYPPIPVKKNTKVRFSSGPIQVFSTFSVTDYDRRNEDVDPVAASAEYELEKRVEKMHVFPVELMKGPEGLGLSIIGMGVGADAGLEKLGIFVKTITDNGAAARDGRIQVNDQIIEVDGKSLVGVTQAYAASVLRNTSGLVKFQIGRERDPENSEVAQLIRLSLQADREKEERLKRQQEEYLRRTLDYSEDSTQPVSANSSVCEGPSSPVQVEHPMEVEATHSQEVESLKRLLQESELSCLLKDDIIDTLKCKLVKLETTGNENELLSERLRQSERELTNIKKEASNLQNMLQQSQAQYMALDKKYNKAKRLVREYQQREVDMCHREEFYQQLLQEKDTEYNALVKKLKDRVINLEHELQETQRKAGFPVGLPYDSATLKLTPQMMRKAPPKPLFQKLETELSDTEISDLSPDGEGVKTATVERKVPIKDELDAAVPQHELLDNSVTKTKIDLASRGGLANRQLPSTANNGNNNTAAAPTTTNANAVVSNNSQISSNAAPTVAINNTNHSHSSSSSSSNNNGLKSLNFGKRTLSNSSSDCALDDSEDDGIATTVAYVHASAASDSNGLSNGGNGGSVIHRNYLLQQQQPPQQQQQQHTHVTNGHHHTVTAGTTTAILLNSTAIAGSGVSAAREQQINQLYAQVHKDHNKSAAAAAAAAAGIGHSTIPNIFKTTISSPPEVGGGVGVGGGSGDFHRTNMTTFGTSNRDLNSSYDSILGSNDKLSENEQSSENWMYPSRRRVGPTGAIISGKMPPSSFTEQLNQALSERERRLGDGSSRNSSDDYTEINKSQSTAAINCKTLINEIRQAVNEAQPKVPWQQQQQQQQQLATGPPSPTSMSSGCSSPGYSPSRAIDLSGSSSSFSDRKAAACYNYKGGPVHEWTKEQVGHWLMGIELERYIPVFKEHNVEGGALLSLDSKDFKTLGVGGDDKHRLKRRLKELKASIEKERKDQERERREREKALRKAEKKAAKKK
ncbi:serine-rich adhesin for platelets isoform X3 [Eurosta solidaginis]|uniref:serine-rich adhesin for platelets isoform X3 n=1 Tax=Eurosta solidaginis TaxID=178769 RepID=UPI003530C01F